ncbi:MAG: hypothetical protein AAF500_08925 [Myxococcota bacterium]
MRACRSLILGGAVVWACALASCASGGTGANGVGGSAGQGGASLEYPLLECDPLVPEFCGYPFPSNVYSVVDPNTTTGRRVSLSRELLLDNDPAPWRHSDGFSAGSPILTFLPGMALGQFGGPDDIDQSLRADSPSLLLDVETGELVPHFAEIDMRAADADERSTMIRPVVRLRDNARYIVAFRGLRNEAGSLIAPSPVFAALRDGTSSSDPSVDSRRALYDDIFNRLSGVGWDASEVQIAWDFTTASDANNTTWLLHMRDEAFSLVERGIEYTIDSVEDDYDPEDFAFRVFGTFRAPLYLTSPDPGALLVFGDDGRPAINPDQPWMDVPFEVLIPRTATTDDPTSIIEYGHGLLNVKEEIESDAFRILMNDHNFTFAATDLIGMSDSDFPVIGVTLAGGNVSGLQTMFDRLHQGFLNYLLLMRMMKTEFANDPTFGPYIDGDSAFYYGISQGGIMGSVFLALSPDVERGALGLVGQPYSMLLFRSVDFNEFLDVIKENYTDVRDHQLIVAALQMLWDRVEPNGYAHHVTRDPLPGVNTKQVLTRVAIGDHEVPTYGGHILARTLGATHLTTGLRDVWGLDTAIATTSGSVLTEYDFAVPPAPLCNVPMSLCNDPHSLLWERVAVARQVNEFLRTGRGENFCKPGDGDEYQVTTEGVCRYPTLGECDPDETPAAAQALCTPGAF